MISEDMFNKLVDEAIDELPEEWRKMLDNVAIFVEDFPTPEQAKIFRLREENIMLLGLYEGIPQTRRARYGVGGQLPDKITLFRIPIVSVTHTKEDLVAQIKDTLRHEIGHHFGMSEEEIRNTQSSGVRDS